jgi:hypothetical protein
MQDDQNDRFPDVPSATDRPQVANESLVKFESKNPETSSKPSKPLQSSSHDFLSAIQKDSKALKDSIDERKKKDASIPKDELKNEIMKRIAAGMQNQDDLIPSERIDEIGIALITSYCSIELAAQKLDMTTARLKWLIANVDELGVYYEVAHEGIKTFTDGEIIRRLTAGDEDVLKLVFNKLYAGRAKGGYNPSEIGTTGYNDKLGKRLAAETEKDRGKGNIQVQFNFIQKEIREDFSQIEVEGTIIEAEDWDDEK